MTKSKIQNKFTSQILVSNFQINPKSQFSKLQTKGFGHWLFVAGLLFGICCVALGISPLFAKDNDKTVDLSRQIMQAKTSQALYAPFEELKDLYFKDNRYADFVEFLKSLTNKKKTLEPFTNYYIALCRYQQLKYLEESQNWEEYFSFGNEYRDELVREAEKTISLTSSEDSINLYARCLLWQFHKDQQDVFAADTLKKLLDSVVEYASKKDDLSPIKYIADKLYSYGSKLESKKLYNIYVDKLLKTETRNEELRKAADSAYQDRNVSLSTIIYDAYIDRIIRSYPKDKSIPILIAIAEEFVYKDEGANDPEYAEKIFKTIEGLGVTNALDEKTSYIRAYNLEKAKFYSASQDKYMRLIEGFPQTSHYEEVLFKCGIISTYVLRDIDRGISFFEKLASRADISDYVISSIYQLGLLSQWRKDLAKAKEYYTRLMELAGEGFGDTKELTQERLKELEKDGEIEYNLKIFLDASLKENFDMTKIELEAYPYKIFKDKDIRISANAVLLESGCMSVEVNYLWSGHLGKSRPSINQSEFITSYPYPGTKEINLVVVNPSGIIDRSIDMVDVE